MSPPKDDEEDETPAPASSNRPDAASAGVDGGGSSVKKRRNVDDDEFGAAADALAAPVASSGSSSAKKRRRLEGIGGGDDDDEEANPDQGGVGGSGSDNKEEEEDDDDDNNKDVEMKDAEDPDEVSAADAAAGADAIGGDEIAYRWLDEGKVGDEEEEEGDERPDFVRHSGIRLEFPPSASSNAGRKEGKDDDDDIADAPTAFTVRVGDSVLLWSDDQIDDDDDDDEGGSSGNGGAAGNRRQAQWICRVKELWEETVAGGGAGAGQQQQQPQRAVRFRAQWFYSPDEIRQYGGKWFGDITKDDLLRQMKPRELLLGDQADVNEIASIQRLVPVAFVDPSNREQQVDDDQWLCRYRIDTKQGSWKLSEWKQESDDLVTTSAMESVSSQSQSEDEDEDASDDDSVSSTDKLRVMIREGEGSSLRQDIQVGESHQVLVKPFLGPQEVKSRNPKLVWSPNKIDEKKLQRFLEDLAKVHSDYLNREGLTSQEPYSPLPAEQAEIILRKRLADYTDSRHNSDATGGAEGPPNPAAPPKLTSSQISTATHLSHRPNGLLKECDVDAVLELLHDHNYDTNAALEAAKADLESISSGWIREEKSIFDDGFRHHGTLRRVAQAVDTKSMKEVVDYWFRFKIPDQFRLYSNKKREQAIRMMECIEKRRFHEFTIGGAAAASRINRAAVAASSSTSANKHWSDISPNDVTGALEERRQNAKAVWLLCQEKIGREKTGEVARVIRELQKDYDEDTKVELFALLKGQSELQKRFLEFLPKNV